MLASGVQFLKQSCARFADLVFPPVCACCSIELVEPVNGGLCCNCFKALVPQYHRKCMTCGAGLNLASENSIREEPVSKCPYCLRYPFRFEQSYSLGNYELELRDSVLSIKSGHRDSLIKELAILLVGKLDRSFDLIIPIPIHWTRRLGRVTVASEELANWMGSFAGIPVAKHLLRYQRKIRKQGKLSTTDRIQNVKGALTVARPRKLTGKNVLLVDDVMTSGATLNESTRVCLKAKAKSVSVAFVARGVGRSMNRRRSRVEGSQTRS